jgi:starch-binding outer membrane protein, SusD/RagB family
MRVMQINKKIFWGVLAAVSLVVVFAGCTKFLDRKPLQATLGDLNQGGLEGQAIGLYGTIRNSQSAPYCGDGFVGIGYIPMQGFRSGDQTVNADPGAAGYITAYSNFQYSKDDWANGVYWDRHYQMVQIANILLQTADSLKLSDPASLINIAEGKWFRAYTYFDLVKNYGEVPLITNRIYQASDGQIPKSAVADVYALIDADLTYAEANLPSAQPSTQIGRLVQNAARMLHAKTYLMRDAPSPTSMDNYSKCLALCQQIIDSKQYSLFSPYWGIWKLANENCSESIFEVQCQQNANTAAGSATTYWSWWGTEQGVRGSGDWNLGWGWNNPTASLVNAYESGDPRKAATILFSGQSDDPANGGYGRTLPPLSNSAYWNKKAYVSPQEQLDAGDPTGAAFVNTRVFRYADVILMAAEAANEIGGASNDSASEAWVEEIRARARGGNNTVLPYIQYQNQAQFRAAIKQERRVEFGMEMERFYDLVRWGDAQSVLGGLGYQPKNEYYPIPSSALAGNPKLVQNPNY